MVPLTGLVRTFGHVAVLHPDGGDGAGELPAKHVRVEHGDHLGDESCKGGR